MWKALIKLVEKWACCHEWEVENKITSSGEREYTSGKKIEYTDIKYLYICKKCGKWREYTP